MFRSGRILYLKYMFDRGSIGNIYCFEQVLVPVAVVSDKGKGMAPVVVAVDTVLDLALDMALDMVLDMALDMVLDTVLDMVMDTVLDTALDTALDMDMVICMVQDKGKGTAVVVAGTEVLANCRMVDIPGLDFLLEHIEYMAHMVVHIEHIVVVDLEKVAQHLNCDDTSAVEDRHNLIWDHSLYLECLVKIFVE
jgi:hypothetical protein